MKETWNEEALLEKQNMNGYLTDINCSRADITISLLFVVLYGNDITLDNDDLSSGIL